MSFQSSHGYNRYSGKKMVKHVALISPRKRQSAVNQLDKIKHKVLNNSHLPLGNEEQSPSKTIDYYSGRRSYNRYELNAHQTKTQVQSIKLPAIYRNPQGYSKHHNSSTEKPLKQKQYSIFSEREKLRPIPQKIIKKQREQYKFITQTKAGLNGKNAKINQDIEIIDQKLPHGIKLFCVCDGHGVNGHHVAGFIKLLMVTQQENLKKRLKNISQQLIQQEIYLVFQRTNQQLLESQINTDLSGSTVIAVFIHGERIYSFNVGDSRAILINYEDAVWKSTAVSNDHKPDWQIQAKRIKANGGRIARQTNQKGEEIGPLRVWMKDVQSPGLAMTRSFGDKAGIKAGTTGDPQVLEFSLHPKNKYLLVASDGVWQQMENYEVVKAISPLLQHDKLEDAGAKLMEKCLKIWNQNYVSRDDITFILVKLNTVTEDSQ